jgi:hypothetical protein
MSSARTTIYDAHFDPRLRRLVQDVLLIGKADAALAFAHARCTTLEAAKTLTDASPCLKRFPAERRSAFLQQLATAEITGACRLHERAKCPLFIAFFYFLHRRLDCKLLDVYKAFHEVITADALLVHLFAYTTQALYSRSEI